MTGRLINADKVQHDICELYKIFGDGMCSLEFIAHMINSVPTVEAIPIEWIYGFWREHMTYGVMRLMMDKWNSGWMPKGNDNDRQID